MYVLQYIDTKTYKNVTTDVLLVHASFEIVILVWMLKRWMLPIENEDNMIGADSN